AAYDPGSGIPVANASNVVCSVTNTRSEERRVVEEVWSGALPGDAPSTTLRIGSSDGGSDVVSTLVTGPAAGSTGAQDVGVGTYFVSETSPTAGWLQTSLMCSTNGGPAAAYDPGSGIPVANASNVVCSVTNT